MSADVPAPTNARNAPNDLYAYRDPHFTRVTNTLPPPPP